MTDFDKAREKFDALLRGETPADSPDFDASKIEPPVEPPASAVDPDLIDFAQDVGQQVDELNAKTAAADAIERVKR
jgi:hypothetical protein